MHDKGYFPFLHEFQHAWAIRVGVVAVDQIWLLDISKDIPRNAFRIESWSEGVEQFFWNRIKITRVVNGISFAFFFFRQLRKFMVRKPVVTQYLGFWAYDFHFFFYTHSIDTILNKEALQVPF